MENSLLRIVKYHFIALSIRHCDCLHRKTREGGNIYWFSIMLHSHASTKKRVKFYDKFAENTLIEFRNKAKILPIHVFYASWYSIHLWQTDRDIMRTRVCIWLLSLQRIINFQRVFPIFISQTGDTQAAT